MRKLVALPAVLVAAGLTVAACGPGLRVDAYPTQQGSTVDCKALFADSPQKVAGEDRILVKDDNAVAWGAPPIIMRCGVEAPKGYSRTADCVDVDDVCWYSEKIKDAYVFTATGREYFVSVEVPDSTPKDQDPLADLADTVQKHIPEKKV